MCVARTAGWARPRKVVAEQGSDVAMLSFVSFSSWALVMLLARWSSSSPRKGGLKDADARDSSADCLQALCMMVAGQERAFVPIIDLSLDWVVKWPRPMEPRQPAPMFVDAFGQLLLGRWVQDVTEQRCLPAHHWFRSREFATMVSELGPEPRLSEVLAQCMQVKALGPLFRHLLWHIGAAVQQAVLSAAKSATRHVTVRMPGIGDALASGAEQCDVQLLRYIRAAQQVGKDQTNYSLCTDKAAVCGLGGGVQNEIFGLQPNLGIIGVPQVFHGSGHEILAPRGHLRPVPPDSGVIGACRFGARGIVLRDVFFRVLSLF